MTARPNGSRLSVWRRVLAIGTPALDPPGGDARPDETFEHTWRSRLKKRVLVVVLGLGVWSAAIEARLVQLQVFDHAEYLDRAAKQQQRVRPLPAKRGDIVDRNGEILAYSIDADVVEVFPAALKDKDADTAVARLCAALNGCTGADQAWIDRLTRQGAYTVIRRPFSPVDIDRVKALKINGVTIESESRRYYPKLDLAAHVLGFVGAENKGLRGIEERYDSVIRGRDGRMRVEVDGKTHAVETHIVQAPTTGATIELTIDQYLQHIAERELAAGVQATHANGGSVVVMDPQTGEILALANYPTYNPNAFQAYTEDEWKNRAAENLYEPGSTFKIVTASAALEEGVMQPADLVDCNPGRISFGARVVTEAKGHNYGVLPFEDVIVKSSNIGAIKIGLKVGAERMSRYVHRFGFGEALAPDFAGQSAGMAGVPPNDSALASMSMGYQVGVTPLQMAAAVSAVANGGTLFQPHVVRATIRGGARQVVAPKALRRSIATETAATMTEIMEAVAVRGTGRKAQLASYQVAGKTGTSAKLIDHRYSQTDYNASFVGFVPSRQPALTIVVVIDTPKGGVYFGGEVAAPIFQRVAEAALRQLAVPPTINPTPPILVTAASAAPVRLAGGPLVMPVVTPLGGQALVPDVRGLSARDALRILTAAGLNMRMAGSGVVTAQTPAAGTPLDRGSWGLLQFGRDAPAAQAPRGGGR
jgi:cell division protein FtsI (penicillin-binding protein 3)